MEDRTLGRHLGLNKDDKMKILLQLHLAKKLASVPPPPHTHAHLMVLFG